MATDAAANLGAGAVRVGLDGAALEEWLFANVAGFAGPLTVEQFKAANPIRPTA